jgi:hypothetical protein
MANNFLKAEQVVRQALGILKREVVLPNLVTRQSGVDFRGAKNDTISIRVPAYTEARTRTLRGGRPITVDNLGETKVDLTLDTDVYKAVAITDEELTLDIRDFGEQVTSPVTESVARGVEDAVAAKMASGTYAVTIEIDNDDPYDSLVDARNALNKARVPKSGRAVAIGSDIEAKILKSDHLARFDQSGSDSALREATIGRMAGFDIVTPDGLDPNVGYAFHKSAFALSMMAPVVPDGVTWGTTAEYAGLAMRLIRDYDFLNVQDRLLADVFIGAAIVLDNGYLDANGVFHPSTDDADADSVTVTAGDETTDVITAAGHGYSNGDAVQFSALTGGAGLATDTTYYVRDKTTNTFKLAATSGGAAINFTTAITAGTIAEQSDPILVRAVKLTDAA